MSKRIRWRAWPRQTAKELNSVSGVAGVGGAAIGIASWSLMAGAPALVLTGFGVLVTVAAFGWAIYRAIPEPSTEVVDLIGCIVSLSELKTLSPKLITLSVVGASMSGKTTLRNRITHTPNQATRTQTVTAQIIVLPTPPPNEVAFLDGGGEKYAQQFDLSKHCDHLCLLVDHNASDSAVKVDKARLKQHSDFFQQIRHYLDENRIPPKQSIQIVMNKRDLWQRASAADLTLVSKFQQDELRFWKEGNRSTNISVLSHSNSDATDVAKFIQDLKANIEASRISNG